MAIIEVKNLSKHYGDYIAVNEVSFKIEEGEIFGLLGANGSGKTTILEMLVGLKKATSGTISVLNYEPFKNRKKLASMIGVQLDYTSLPLNIKPWEAISLFASFYHKKCAVEEILARFGLEAKKETFYGHLSWGEKQRLGLAIACINEPDILFLDEPTSRLDPIGQEEFSVYIRKLKELNKTILINTHNLNEAENLCDCVGIMHKGKLCVNDSPENLIDNLGYDFRITVETIPDFNLHLNGLKVIKTKTHIHIYTNQPNSVIRQIQNITNDFSKAKVNFSDVFLIAAGEEYNE